MTTAIGARRWVLAGRHYEVSRFDSTTWALEDVGPAPERGQVLVAFRDDLSDELHVTAFARQTLPAELVERFLLAVRDDTAPDG